MCGCIHVYMRLYCTGDRYTRESFRCLNNCFLVDDARQQRAPGFQKRILSPGRNKSIFDSG